MNSTSSPHPAISLRRRWGPLLRLLGQAAVATVILLLAVDIVLFYLALVQKNAALQRVQQTDSGLAYTLPAYSLDTTPTTPGAAVLQLSQAWAAGEPRPPMPRNLQEPAALLSVTSATAPQMAAATRVLAGASHILLLVDRACQTVQPDARPTARRPLTPPQPLPFWQTLSRSYPVIDRLCLAGQVDRVAGRPVRAAQRLAQALACCGWLGHTSDNSANRLLHAAALDKVFQEYAAWLAAGSTVCVTGTVNPAWLTRNDFVRHCEGQRALAFTLARQTLDARRPANAPLGTTALGYVWYNFLMRWRTISLQAHSLERWTDVIAVVQQPPYQRQAATMTWTPAPWHAVVPHPAADVARIDRTLARQQLLRLALQLRCVYEENNDYPSSLAALPLDATATTDPYTGNLIRYSRTPGTVTLAIQPRGPCAEQLVAQGNPEATRAIVLKLKK